MGRRALWPFVFVAALSSACAISHRRYGSDDVTSDVTGELADATDVPTVDAADAADTIDVQDVVDALDAVDATDVVDALDVPDTFCPAPMAVCTGLCVPVDRPRRCGSCTHDCTVLPHVDGALVQCGAGGRCNLIAACDPGWGDCNATPDDGCETDIGTTASCGACFRACTGTTPNCSVMPGVDAGLTTAMCTSGCMGASPDRCGVRCTDVRTDVTNCGVCGTVCRTPARGTATCSGGACGFRCDPGSHACLTDCFDNMSTLSCGARCAPCAVPANASATCDGVNCGYTCNAGFHDCGGLCVSNSSLLTCGAACSPCPMQPNAVATCDGVRCGFSCDAGFHNCGGTCLSNLSTMSCGASCGLCASPPNGMATCDGSACGYTCNAGFHDCSGNCSPNASPLTCGGACSPCGVPVNGRATCDGVNCGIACDPGFVASGTNCNPIGTTVSCPGSAVTLPPNVLATLRGSTAGGTITSGSCRGTMSPEVVYAVTVPANGTLGLTLHPAGWRGALYVRSVCATSSSELSGACDFGNNPGDNVILRPLVSAGTYYVFVDGSSGDLGAFALDMLFVPTAAVCGDRTISGGETCDDGNAVSGDGCNAVCMLEAPQSNTCPGPAIALGLGSSSYLGDTAAATNGFTPTCTGTAGPDRLYQVTPAGTSLRVDLVPRWSTYDPVLHARAACPGVAGATCANSGGPGVAESFTMAVTAGAPVWIVVDGAGGTVGPYLLRFTVM